VDERYAKTGTVCGFVPWGMTMLPLGDALSTSLQLAPVQGRLGLHMQLALPAGTKVQIPNPEFRLENPNTGQEYSARLDPFRISILGRGGRPGRFEVFEADARLEGLGRNAELAGPNTQYAKYDLFSSSTRFIMSAANTLVLKVPAIEVNGVLLDAQSVPMRLVEKSGLATCIQ